MPHGQKLVMRLLQTEYDRAAQATVPGGQAGLTFGRGAPEQVLMMRIHKEQSAWPCVPPASEDILNGRVGDDVNLVRFFLWYCAFARGIKNAPLFRQVSVNRFVEYGVKIISTGKRRGLFLVTQLQVQATRRYHGAGRLLSSIAATAGQSHARRQPEIRQRREAMQGSAALVPGYKNS